MIFSSSCGIFIAIGIKSSNPFPYMIFLNFTLLIFSILVILRRISLRDLLGYCFVLCCCRCLLLVLWITGQKLSLSLSQSYEHWMSGSTPLESFSLLWMEVPLSRLAGFLVEVPLYSDGLCPLKFPRHFTPLSMLHQFNAVSFQVLILDSLYSGLVFFFIQVGFYLKSLLCVLLVLDSFPL